MKKKFLIALLSVLIVIFATEAAILVLPYKPKSFVVDGVNFSASVENGNSMLLSLENEGGEWSIKDHPKQFKTDYGIKGEDVTEYHIYAVEKGTEKMQLRHQLENGDYETYQLILEISRHKKNNLQIENVYFVNTTKTGTAIIS